MEVDTRTIGSLQLEPRGALIKRLVVAKGPEGSDHLGLAGGVDVDVDVSVVPGLPSGQGVRSRFECAYEHSEDIKDHVWTSDRWRLLPLHPTHRHP